MNKIAKYNRISGSKFKINGKIDEIPAHYIVDSNEYYYFLKSFTSKIYPMCEEIQRASIYDFLDRKKTRIFKDLIEESKIDYFPKEGMEHQNKAFEKLKNQKVAIIDGDVGVGKTKIYIDLADNHVLQGRIDRVFLIAPPVTLDKFKKEVDRFSTHSKDLWEFHSCFEFSKKRVDFGSYKISPMTLIIIDESHRIKNIESYMTKNIIILSFLTSYKIIGTGTLVPNNPIDLVPQSSFISLRIYGLTIERYAKEIAKKFHKKGDKGIVSGAKNITEIISAPFPYIYSIRKKEVLKNLPETFHEKYEAKITDKFLEWSLQKKEALQFRCNRASMSYMAVLQELRKIACGYDFEEEHPKTIVLKEILMDIPKDEKVIIWHTMYCEISFILDALKDREDIAYLNGASGCTERLKELSDFRFGDKNILIATQAVGGEGLDLFESCVNIYYSNSFNYKDREQSEGRTHRMGQKRGVFYYDIVCNSTIDKRIFSSISRKSSFLDEFKELCDNNGIQKAIGEVL